MENAVIFIGIQACGKTTFYNRNFSELVHINLDELHTRNKEKLLMAECIASGISFVVDNTNPTKKDREKYIHAAREAGYHIIGYYFRSSVGESISRNALRTGKANIPSCAIAGTYKILELPEWAEGFDELYYVHIENDKFIVEKWKDEDI